MFSFTLVENLVINVGVISISVIAIILYFARHPTHFERVVRFVNKWCKGLLKKSERAYVRYDIQSKLNVYIDKARKDSPQIETQRAKLEWVELNGDKESFLNNGQLVIRLVKSDNQNRNLVNATMAFVSSGYLNKAKSYIAKYQKEAINLYVCHDILSKSKREIVDQFVQDFLKGGLENDKTAELFDKFIDIDRGGMFYQIFIQELTFFGEKVFTRKKDSKVIFDQIKSLVMYLYNYAHRKRDQKMNDYDGVYSKFAIRIVGKSNKISREGENVYLRNLAKLDHTSNETLYILGASKHKKFISRVGFECSRSHNYDVLYKKEYPAIIKDDNGNDRKVHNYLMVLRNNNIERIKRR